ncbi:MAG: TIGR03546 family protein [Rubripirellula sp.]
MILWILKLISSVRRAIAGRKYPHQLAWAVAFGLLLGVVPHGNLLAVAILLVVLSLKINHAMAGLTAVGATFLATKLDPYSHEVGNFVLTHPQLNQTANTAWSLPLVPWTDLNNTVVMGSFLIGVGALVPVFFVAYPVFRLMAPAAEPTPLSELPNENETVDNESETVATDDTHQVVLIDHGHDTPARPHADREVQMQTTSDRDLRDEEELLDFIEIEDEPDQRVAIETRIDVIRMTDHRAATTEADVEASDPNDPQPMDEALNYLLRQLRDSQQRKAA